MDNLPNSLERIKFHSWNIDSYDVNMFPDSSEKIIVNWHNEKLIKKLKVVNLKIIFILIHFIKVNKKNDI